MCASSFVIGSKRYRFLRRQLGYDPSDGVKIWGLCDPPEKQNKAISVCVTATGLTELYTIIHEIKHAENWDGYKEEYVIAFADTIADVVWEGGYRKVQSEAGFKGFTKLEALVSRTRFKLEGFMYEPEYIKKTSHEMALILWKLGYRYNPLCKLV